jgi:pyruvate/2-oxoglutarate dehydrogenase complex dihydrolipoamide dehydrogenase (E3) component
MAAPELLPRDEHNESLIRNLHPADWTNPEPAPRYNLVVLGAGTAGLIAAAGAAGLGARVALVERNLLGGDALNTGCVPSKTLIRSARSAAEVARAGRFGVRVPAGAAVDFAAAMERVRRVRSALAPHSSVWRFRDQLGVDVFLGAGHFTGRDRLEVAGASLRFARAVIATGARPAAPAVEGLEQTGYLTSESVFSLTERPARLAVVGAGPVGCELAQSFQRLGCQVTLFESEAHILPREDADAAGRVQRALAADGVELELGATLEKVERTGSGKLLYYRVGGEARQRRVDEIIVGAGRTPNVEDLGLEQAGVRCGPEGVRVNARLRTSNRRIFAAGDVCLPAKYTHTADAAAKLVLHNALFFGRRRYTDWVVPSCTYTDPELAQAGLAERDAADAGIDVERYEVPLARNDRSVTEGDDGGLVRILVRRGSDEIVGATVVASHAGDLIGQIALAMQARIGLGRLYDVIHPYPTQAEAIKACAAAFNRARFTPASARFYRFLLRLRR